jgi:adenylyltransferase/sulfurtransferase
MSDFPLHIDVRSVKDLLDSDEDFLLLDCREQDEYDLVRIDGARLFPLSEAANWVDELHPFRDRRIVAYCHRGIRSLQLTQWLRSQGFAKVQNMMGGIDSWSLVIDTRLPRY